MNLVEPWIELDEEEEWLDNRGSDRVVNFVRVTPYQSLYPSNSDPKPKYIIITYLVTWTKDYGRFGQEAHVTDRERIVMAWRLDDPEGRTLKLEWVFTSAHYGATDHHAVWNPLYWTCNRGNIARVNGDIANWEINGIYDTTQVLCSNLEFGSDQRLKVYASQGKHALYPTRKVCEDVRLVGSAGEDCGWDPSALEWSDASFSGDARYAPGGRWRFTNYNVGEPGHWLYSGTVEGFSVPSIFENSLNDVGGPQRMKDRLDSLYIMEIKTGDVNKAGTDAKISVSISGTAPYPYTTQLSYDFYSHPKPPINIFDVGNFERNNTDRVFFGQRDYGDITSVRISHDNSGDGSGWYLYSFWITNKMTGKTWYFTPNQWLANDEGPHQRTWDDFTPSSTN